jgi:hypothetical protein
VTWAKGTQIICLCGLLSLSAAAQRGGAHFAPPAQAKPGPANAPKQPKNSNNGGRNPGRKMGDWLREHQNLSPDQQEKLLESDPNFKRLPPERQSELKERLRKFNSLPPQQRERALQRMEFMASLTPEQRQQIRLASEQLQGLPQDRQIMVHKALRHLRQMDPQERQQVFDSERFKSTFSDQERGILTRLSAINPPEGEGGPNPQAPSNQSPR